MNQTHPHYRRYADEIETVSRVIAANLLRLRRQNRLTLKAVSEAAGISVAHVNRIEHGHSSAHLNTLQKLADIYGVPLSALFECGET